MAEHEALSQVTAKHGIAPSLAAKWRDELISGARDVYDKTRASRERNEKEEAAKSSMKMHLRPSDKLLLSVTSSRGFVTNTDTTQRQHMASGKLPKELDMVRECELLSVSRATVYRRIAKGEDGIAHASSKDWSEEDEHLAAIIDRIHLGCPVNGARKIAKLLKRQGEKTATRYKVGSLMKLMGIRPCCPVPPLSKPAKASEKFPHLLKDKKLLFANQVWSTDITHVLIGGKHMYLTAVIDWYSRYIVSRRLSDTMKAQEVVMCAKQAFIDWDTPSIMNSDQGSVFSSDEYVALLSSKGIAQSMDGKARWKDNVIIERWFRTLKSECLRLSEYSTPQELGDIIAKFVESYNSERIHQSLDYETPEMWYFAGITKAT